jgi:AcrR family transcriptional regulator
VDTRAQILDAAAQVISSKGLARATTKEIARAAACAEGTLYKHFADKSELFLAVLQERAPQFLAILMELPQRAGRGTVRRNLEEVLRAAFDFFSEVIPMSASLFAQPELLRSHVQEMRARDLGPHRGVAAIAEYLKAEQRAGRVNERIDPRSTSAALLGTCFFLAYMRHFYGEDVLVDPDRFAREVAKAIIGGIQERKGVVT